MMVTFSLTMVRPRYNLKVVSLRQLCRIAPFVLTQRDLSMQWSIGQRQKWVLVVYVISVRITFRSVTAL